MTEQQSGHGPADEVSGGGRPSDTSDSGTTGSAVPAGGGAPGSETPATPNPGIEAPRPGGNVASDATAPGAPKAPLPHNTDDTVDDEPHATALEGGPSGS